MISIALAFLGVVGAQLTYRESPELEWDARVPSLREGNGVFLSPDDGIIIASSSVGQISAFRATDGAEIFQYSYGPNATVEELISSSSGISFSNDTSVIFSILVNENSLNPST
jgi:outer membrane protein assembly factor BamB